MGILSYHFARHVWADKAHNKTHEPVDLGLLGLKKRTRSLELFTYH